MNRSKLKLVLVIVSIIVLSSLVVWYVYDLESKKTQITTMTNTNTTTTQPLILLNSTNLQSFAGISVGDYCSYSATYFSKNGNQTNLIIESIIRKDYLNNVTLVTSSIVDIECVDLYNQKVSISSFNLLKKIPIQVVKVAPITPRGIESVNKPITILLADGYHNPVESYIRITGTKWGETGFTDSHGSFLTTYPYESNSNVTISIRTQTKAIDYKVTLPTVRYPTDMIYVILSLGV